MFRQVGLRTILTFPPDFRILPAMKTMFYVGLHGRVAKGSSMIHYLAPLAVEDYIRQHRLYPDLTRRDSALHYSC